ncbi:hypothetical protein CCY01nite_20590 [Chitinophaga cymbidii]|uniref:Uncharacterized protein n=1 Tax=Chitinophaga cymbidii TaxID=1096750 RepID=A0A512RJA8_9BACT|nr:hypothetical protein CCY01nite_20590 [Chitinophaga cymbidii]
MFALSCTKRPYKVETKFIAGYLIGKETCHPDPDNDYWLLDCTVHPNTPSIGDTIVVDNETYTNVIKVKGLLPELQELGTSIGIEYKTITREKVETTGCEVPSPVTYHLKEIFIIHQGIAR